METWEAIRTRRNVRSFDDRPLPDEHLDRIVAAAALAPSSMNEQRSRPGAADRAGSGG
jgi:nitroreductase